MKHIDLKIKAPCLVTPILIYAEVDVREEGDPIFQVHRRALSAVSAPWTAKKKNPTYSRYDEEGQQQMRNHSIDR